jgi:protein tyrosine/serine phosphatase
MLVATTGAAAQSESREELLPNFHQVNEHLYRGGQPLPGGIKRLSALGIKTIINLRGLNEKSRAEEEEARLAGLRYIRVPMSGMKRPSDERVEEVLAIINQPENWPIFVHCKHGEDRTGTIIAVYRISHDNWTYERAKEEARNHGFSRMQFLMKDYIKDYERKHQRRAQHVSPKAISSLLPVRLSPQAQKLAYDF